MTNKQHIVDSAVETKFHSQSDGSLLIERVADVQGILDSAKELRNMGAGKSKSGDLYHVARIPFVFIEKYCNEKGISYEEWQNNDVHVSAILNDPDYKLFRISEGRV